MLLFFFIQFVLSKIDIKQELRKTKQQINFLNNKYRVLQKLENNQTIYQEDKIYLQEESKQSIKNNLEFLFEIEKVGIKILKFLPTKTKFKPDEQNQFITLILDQDDFLQLFDTLGNIISQIQLKEVSKLQTNPSIDEMQFSILNQNNTIIVYQLQMVLEGFDNQINWKIIQLYELQFDSTSKVQKYMFFTVKGEKIHLITDDQGNAYQLKQNAQNEQILENFKSKQILKQKGQFIFISDDSFLINSKPNQLNCNNFQHKIISCTQENQFSPYLFVQFENQEIQIFDIRLNNCNPIKKFDFEHKNSKINRIYASKIFLFLFQDEQIIGIYDIQDKEYKSNQLPFILNDENNIKIIKRLSYFQNIMVEESQDKQKFYFINDNNKQYDHNESKLSRFPVLVLSLFVAIVYFLYKNKYQKQKVPKFNDSQINELVRQAEHQMEFEKKKNQ